MKRYRELEELQAKGRADLARAVPVWLDPAREVFERLARMVVDPKVSDDDFLAAVEKAAEELPDLYDRLDKLTLAEVFEGYMGAAMAGGIEAMLEQAAETQDDKTQDTR